MVRNIVKCIVINQSINTHLMRGMSQRKPTYVWGTTEET